MNGSWAEISLKLSETTGEVINFTQKEAVFGGDINQAWKVTDSHNRHWFIKTNGTNLLAMFKAEAEGLKEIAQSRTIRCPIPYCYGTTVELSYLVMEYIDLSSLTNQPLVGEQLAKMHNCFSTDVFSHDKNNPFGWTINNTIGSTSQSNKRHQSWGSFYKKERLLFQLEKAKKKNYPSIHYENGLLLLEKIHQFFDQYTPKPSLLHGDLWGGNCASDEAGNPVIFDPAIYYGDRETDIAMTELFGGFNSTFYSSYNNYYPLDQGYPIRKNLYNLYHVLNHLNLFGGSYAAQAGDMTLKLLSEV